MILISLPYFLLYECMLDIKCNLKKWPNGHFA